MNHTMYGVPKPEGPLKLGSYQNGVKPLNVGVVSWALK